MGPILNSHQDSRHTFFYAYINCYTLLLKFDIADLVVIKAITTRK